MATPQFRLRPDREFYLSYFGNGWFDGLMEWGRRCNALHREMVLTNLSKVLEVARTAETPTNVLLTGGPGTGKSLCTFSVLEDLASQKDRGCFLAWMAFPWKTMVSRQSVVRPIQTRLEFLLQLRRLPGVSLAHGLLSALVPAPSR